MDISVTFPAGPSGPSALVRFKEPGQKPTYRTLPMDGCLEESMEGILAFIWAHVDGQPHCRQGWLWEA